MDDLDTAQQGALHLNYHLKMMANLATLSGHYDAEGPAVLKNATLEGMLIHTRLLIEFIAGRPKDNPTERKRSDWDLQPKDFGLMHWDDTPILNLDGYLRLADKHVVHLSKERFETASIGRTWATDRMVEAILDTFSAFAIELRRTGIPRPAETVESGIIEARNLLTQPSLDWPPEFSN
jgi:hypothetical protein